MGQNTRGVLKDLKENSLSVDDLEILLQAERYGKNRQAVTDALVLRLEGRKSFENALVEKSKGE